MDISNGGSGPNVQIWKTNARWFQLWRYRELHVINERGKALDVLGGIDEENR